MKTNFKKIQARFRRRSLLRVLLVGSILAIVLLLLMNVLPIEIMMGLVVLGVLVVLVLFIIALFGGSKANRLKRSIQRQGTLESFNASEFVPVGNSGYLYHNNDWLVWNRDYEYQAFARNHIRGIQAHPNQREENVLALLDIFMSDRNNPIQVLYKKDPNENLPQMVWNWASAGSSLSYPTNTAEVSATPTEKPVIQDGKIICPCCMAPNDAGLEYCVYCGSKLSRVPNDTSM